MTVVTSYNEELRKYMNKRIKVDAKKCDVCYLCELACSYKNEGKCMPSASRIKVQADDKTGIAKPSICIQCISAKCMEACKIGAIYRESTGVIKIDYNKCTNCKLCIDACKMDCMTYVQRLGKVVKCDTCDGKPECVRICPSGALSLIDNK